MPAECSRLRDARKHHLVSDEAIFSGRCSVSPGPTKPSRFPWLLMAFAVCLRGSVLLTGQASLRDDPDAYARLAVNWSDTGVFGLDANSPTAFRPPLYPWLLSWLVDNGVIAPTSVAVLHLLLGLGLVWLTWSIAQDLGLSKPWLPALLVSVDPLLLRASTLVMTETLAAFLGGLAWKLWLYTFPVGTANSMKIERSSTQWLTLVTLGLTFGLSILARPTAAPWVALCLVGIWFADTTCWKRRLRDSVLVGLLVIGCLAPWVLRNYVTFGKPIWATTHGGYTLLLANNPLLYDHFRQNGPSRNWDAEPFHELWAHQHASTVDQASEVASDRQDYQLAWDTITVQPSQFLTSCLYRVGWLWAWWPNTGSQLSRLVIGLWYAVVLTLAIPGTYHALRRQGLRCWLLPLALVVALSAVHAVYWSNMRMRAPAMAMVCMAASLSLHQKTRSSKLRF